MCECLCVRCSRVRVRSHACVCRTDKNENLGKTAELKMSSISISQAILTTAYLRDQFRSSCTLI